MPPCPAALLPPGAPQTPFQGHEGPRAVLGPERDILDKGGRGGGGWCSSSFPAGTKAKQTESVSVSVSVPVSMSVSMPTLLPGLCGQPVWQRVMPWGRPPSPLPCQVPTGTPSPRTARLSPGGPPRPPACHWYQGDGFPAGRAVAVVAACPEVPPPATQCPQCPHGGSDLALVPRDVPSQPDGSLLSVNIPRGAASPHRPHRNRGAAVSPG